MSGGETLAEALDYVGNGYKLGPVTIRLVDGKKRARFHTRWSEPGGISDDPEQIKAWARERPGVSFHAPTEVNNFVVADGDVKRDAEGHLVADGVSSWLRANGPDSTMVVSTASGGRHWYFRAPAEPIGNSANAIEGVPNVDVRGTRLGDKGQAGTVFISGTTVEGGGHYTANRIVPVADLPELPAAWAERLRKAGPSSGAGRARRAAPRTTAAGTPSRLVGGGSVHDAAWIEAKVDDELRELVRRGRGDFRARLFAAAAIAYRAVEAGVLDEDEVDERLHEAISRVWGAEPDRDDRQWLAEARETAAGDPWRVAAGPSPLETKSPEPAPPTEDATEDDDREHLRLVDGGSFIFDAPSEVPALWGTGEEVLWAEGEPLLITGPPGVGKTTLGGQVVAGRLGLLGDVLGHKVAPGERVLYLAMDRPAQIRRALGRLLRQYPRHVLSERLAVWQGPPPRDLARHPDLLRELAEKANADTVVIDSLKDAAVKLSDEEVGQGLNRAMQRCVAEGVEVLGFHHQTKRGGGGIGKPNSLADVYGSAWITAGAGSVVLLWGEAGDPVVELSHLKQPAAPVGPLQVVHDHDRGTSSVQEAHDVAGMLALGPRTAQAIARVVHGTAEPTRAQVEKARRKLDALVRSGEAVKLDDAARGGSNEGSKGGSTGSSYGLARDYPDRRTAPGSTHGSTHAGGA